MQGEKLRRQRSIIDLLRHDTISSQEELRRKLKEVGISVTQATLSRDLKELGVVKVVGSQGEYQYAASEIARDAPVVTCEVSGNLVVVRTSVGMAPAVAYRIDAMKQSEILGTVAGENTLLVVVAEDADIQRVREYLWAHLNEV
jgi:transcriptional regulator of arginine metabolism